MAQINKIFAILILFSTVFREMEDLIHNWEVFFKIINNDYLKENRCCHETEGIVMNISIIVNKI